MNGYNFTDRVGKVLQFAREEAARLQHEFVGTEHILLGLIREGEGPAVAVLFNLNVDLEEVPRRVEAMVPKGKATGGFGPDKPYTSRAKKILEFAMSEARGLRHAYVGTEHLLLGLLAEKKGIAAQVLTDLGVTLEQARAETLRLLGLELPGQAVLAVKPDPGGVEWRRWVRGHRAEVLRQMAALVEGLGHPNLAAVDVQRIAHELGALIAELQSVESGG